MVSPLLWFLAVFPDFDSAVYARLCAYVSRYAVCLPLKHKLYLFNIAIFP